VSTVAQSVITPHVVIPAQPQFWYAVFTLPRHEKRVREFLRLKGIETFLPLYASVRKWNNGCRVTVQEPLFPGYLFVHVSDFGRRRVLETVGVVSIVGNSQGPTPLMASEIESLRKALQCRDFDPHPYLTEGATVRVTRGPLAGFDGVLIRRDNDLRIVINVPAIMQGVAVHVEADEVVLTKRSLSD
jgi:transcription termination/antitermination protein NusG